MRVVALEEHFTVPALVRRIDPGAISRRGFRPRKTPANGPNPLELLPDIGERRLKSMDEAGITVQVLSNSGPGPDLVPGPDGVAMAREMNDHLATAIARHPNRLAGFAALPMQRPDACADELARAVKDLRFVGALINGTTEGRFLDHPSYDDLLAAAVELDVPRLLQSAAGCGSRARVCRMGMAFGDGDTRASHGACWDAGSASAVAARHRPHGRNVAGNAGAH